MPELLFTVSLRPTGAAYSPSLDCRDGVFTLGRLITSVALIDITKPPADG